VIFGGKHGFAARLAFRAASTPLVLFESPIDPIEASREVGRTIAFMAYWPGYLDVFVILVRTVTAVLHTLNYLFDGRV
jgi:hypothetical protein